MCFFARSFFVSNGLAVNGWLCSWRGCSLFCTRDTAKASRTVSASMQEGEQPWLLKSTLADAKYRTALDRWRRCHAEGAVIARELRAVESSHVAVRRGEALRRVLSQYHVQSLHIAFRSWLTACMSLSFQSALRRERAIAKEAEAQLALAQEEHRAAREEMSHWKQREEEDRLAIVAALEETQQHPHPPPDTEVGHHHQRPTQQQHHHQHHPQQLELAQTPRVAPQAALLPPTSSQPDAFALTSEQPQVSQQLPPPPAVQLPYSPATSCAGAKAFAAAAGSATPRPSCIAPPPRLGARAGSLLAAWRREAEAAGC